jgi:hypothetical protein
MQLQNLDRLLLNSFVRKIVLRLFYIRSHAGL